jgi:hypothetical protein
MVGAVEPVEYEVVPTPSRRVGTEHQRGMILASKQATRLGGLAAAEKTIRMMLLVSSTSKWSMRAEDFPSTAIRISSMKSICSGTSVG